jgi:hypothetical protein
MKGSGGGLIEILSLSVPGGILSGVLVEIRTEQLWLHRHYTVEGAVVRVGDHNSHFTTAAMFEDLQF